MPEDTPNDGGGGPGEARSEGASPFDSGEFFVPAGPGPAVPERIGPYRIIRPLGKGGMGVVYLARREDQQIRQDVALKLARVGVDSEEYVRRFKRERELLYGLNHPNIARILDGGATEDGQPFFVMEYVEGQRIDEYCDEHRLGTADRLRLFAQVCDGIRHCHQHLVVHRDIKPGNILVTKEGVPKILDFGIAKLLEHGPWSHADQTEPALRLMTFAYASPEQVRGTTITPSSDIYSLGVLLYELVTGRTPYKLEDRVRAKIEAVICNQNPEPPSTAITKPYEKRLADGTTSTIAPEDVARLQESKPTSLRRQLTGDVDDIVMVALAKSPRLRYGSVEQLQRDIEAHLEGRPVEARRIRRSVNWSVYAGRRFARRHRVAIASVAAAMIALAVGLSIALWQWRAAEASERRTRALANALIEEVHDRVLPLAGSMLIRDRLVELGVDELEAMERRAGVGDGSILLEVATGYDRLGDVLAGVRTPHVGDLEGAERLYRRALELRERARGAGVGGQALAVALSRSDLRLGDAARERGDNAEAVDRYRAGLDRLEAAGPLGADGDVLGARIRVSLANAMARLALEDGTADTTADDRLALLRQSERAMRAVVSADPTDAHRHELARALHNLGDHYYHSASGKADQPMYDRAAPFYVEAARTYEMVFSARPTDAHLRSRLAGSEMWAGRCLVALGEVEEGRRLLEASIRRHEFLVEADPSDEHARLRLGLALELLGISLEAIDPVRAAEALERGTRLAREVVARWPDSTRGLRQVAFMSYRLGRALNRAEAWERAIDAEIESARWFRRLFDEGHATAEQATIMADLSQFQLFALRRVLRSLPAGDEAAMRRALDRLNAVASSMDESIETLASLDAAEAPATTSESIERLRRYRERVQELIDAG